MNNIDITKYLAMYFGDVFFRENEEDFYNDLIKNKDNRTFSIYLNQEKKVVGNVTLRVDYRNRKGSLGIAIFNENYHSKGVGTKAIKMLLKYSFEILGLHKVHLTLIGNNDRARKCYEKCGFKEVGRHKEHLYVMGKYTDEILMEILKKDYNNKK